MLIRRGRCLQVLKVRIRPVLLALLGRGSQSIKHKVHFIYVIDVVLGARWLLAQRAYVLVRVTCEVDVASFRLQKIVNIFIPSVCT